MSCVEYSSREVHLQEAVKVPLLVGGKALHQHADLAGQVGLELQVTDFEVVQQLLGQCLDVALINQGIHQLQRSPPAPRQQKCSEHAATQSILARGSTAVDSMIPACGQR